MYFSESLTVSKVGADGKVVCPRCKNETKVELPQTPQQREKLDGLNWLQVYGKSAGKGAIFSFNLEGGAHAHDVSTIVDRKGVAVRAGHHCAQPLMTHLGVTATCRASFGLYNTTAEVDVLVEALELCHELFG